LPYYQSKRVLLYYGELDILCNFMGARWYAESLGQEVCPCFYDFQSFCVFLIQVLEGHRIWYFLDENNESQVAGSVVKFQDLLFVSIKV
jgi:cathepsin A (carboxypeptidase C)